jgi:SNF2 family DNA or RNA helicase
MQWLRHQRRQLNSYGDRQKQSVIVHHLLVENSVDEHVLQVLQGKEKGQDALLEAVKARMEEYR